MLLKKLFLIVVSALALTLVLVATQGCDTTSDKVVDSVKPEVNENVNEGMLFGEEAQRFLKENGVIKNDCDTPDKLSSVTLATLYPNACFVISAPWMSQMPPKNSWDTDAKAWTLTYNCGPAVAAMLGGKYNNGSTQPWVIDAQNTWMHHPLPYGSGTGASTMQSLLWAFHGLHSSSYVGNDADDVVMEGYHGRPVIVGVRTKMSATGGRSHWMLFLGYSHPYMYFHDPGRSSASDGRYVRYTINQFKASWTKDGKRYIPVWK